MSNHFDRPTTYRLRDIIGALFFVLPFYVAQTLYLAVAGPRS